MIRELELTGFHGLASDEVVRSFGLKPPRKDEPAIWLYENVKEDSAWAHMIPETEEWFYRTPERGTFVQQLLRCEATLTAGEIMTASFADSDPNVIPDGGRN